MPILKIAFCVVTLFLVSSAEESKPTTDKEKTAKIKKAVFEYIYTGTGKDGRAIFVPVDPEKNKEPFPERAIISASSYDCGKVYKLEKITKSSPFESYRYSGKVAKYVLKEHIYNFFMPYTGKPCGQFLIFAEKEGARPRLVGMLDALGRFSINLPSNETGMWHVYFGGEVEYINKPRSISIMGQKQTQAVMKVGSKAVRLVVTAQKREK